MAGRPWFLVLALVAVAAAACTAEKPVEKKAPERVVYVKPKPPVLTPAQRRELDFPPGLIKKTELAAGAEAEPFFVTVMLRSENLKGEKGFENEQLAGFSVRTKQADELIATLRAPLRLQGFLIFKSRKSYGSLPELVTVVKGNNSYDILKIQGTEASNFHLSNKAIIAWLKARQLQGSFVITGAGPDWLEARFIKQPKNWTSFAKRAAAFAPDILAHETRTVERLAAQMKRMNGFYLTWD